MSGINKNPDKPAPEEQEKNYGFPLEGSKDCPLCGTPGIMATLVEKLENDGIVTKGVFSAIQLQAPMTDPNKLMTLITPIANIPVIAFSVDACPRCLTLFLVKADFSFQQAKVQFKGFPGMPEGGAGNAKS